MFLILKTYWKFNIKWFSYLYFIYVQWVVMIQEYELCFSITYVCCNFSMVVLNSLLYQPKATSVSVEP